MRAIPLALVIAAFPAVAQYTSDPTVPAKPPYNLGDKVNARTVVSSYYDCVSGNATRFAAAVNVTANEAAEAALMACSDMLPMMRNELVQMTPEGRDQAIDGVQRRARGTAILAAVTARMPAAKK